MPIQSYREKTLGGRGGVDLTALGIRRVNKCTFHLCKQTLCKIERKSVKVPRRAVDTDF